MKRFEVYDSTGRTWHSDPDVDGLFTSEAIAQVLETFKDLKSVESLHLVIDDVDHFFNPDHIVSWAIVEVSA